MPEVGGTKSGAGLDNKRVFSGSGIAVQVTGEERERTANDWYPTDSATVEACLRFNAVRVPTDEVFYVLDPGAGDGVWGRVFRKLYPRKRYPLLKIIGVELDSRFQVDPAYDVWLNENFITGIGVRALISSLAAWAGFDYIIGNPPYELDTEFLAQAFRLVRKDTGRVDFLYRLGFLAAEERVYDFYGRGYAASLALVCNTRPSFLPPEEQAAKGKRATYPGDFTFYTWQFDRGMPDEAKQFDHLVFKTCKTCGAVFYPISRKDRYCLEHTATQVTQEPIDWERYVDKGYRAFLAGNIRKAEKRAVEIAQAGNEVGAARFWAEAERWENELAAYNAIIATEAAAEAHYDRAA